MCRGCEINAFTFADDSAFGFFGTGGSFAYADPEYKVGYAYVMSKMGYYNYERSPGNRITRDDVYLHKKEEIERVKGVSLK